MFGMSKSTFGGLQSIHFHNANCKVMVFLYQEQISNPLDDYVGSLRVGKILICIYIFKKSLLLQRNPNHEEVL